MNNLEKLTIVIVTYKTNRETIINCLKSIDSSIKVKIIENSTKFEFENEVLKNFQNTKIFCTGDNLGYGKGNNFGLNIVETEYALILNPDLICEKDFFINLSKNIETIEDFTLIGSQYIDDDKYLPAGFFDTNKNNDFQNRFNSKKIELIEKVDWIKGFSILVNLNKFKNKKIFDENYFLFFEEIDLCKSIIDKGENIFTCSNLKIHHLGFQSSSVKNDIEKKFLNRVREWHWMWSSYYFYKKNYGIIFAIKKMIGKFLKSFFKIIYYSLIFQKNKKEKYLYRFLGIYNSMIGNPSSFRDK